MMENVSETNFGGNEIILKNQLVKSAILPQSSRELTRNITIQGETQIEGAVYAEKIDVTGGNVTFKGPVFGNSEVHLANDLKAPVVFQKAVASADTIAALSVSQHMIFQSDINAKTVRLKNCYVGGSVFADTVYLENCVVLGGVFGTKEITIASCMIGTFHAPSVEISGTNFDLYPACFSVEPIDALPEAVLYNLSLADLGSLYKGDKEKENTGKIKVDFTNDCQKMMLVGDHDETTVVLSYSVSSRVLAADMVDFNKMENHFLIEAGALGPQILKVYSLTKEDGTKSQPLTVENIASFMFDILCGKIQISEIAGEVSFDDLARNFHA